MAKSARAYLLLKCTIPEMRNLKKDPGGSCAPKTAKFSAAHMPCITPRITLKNSGPQPHVILAQMLSTPHLSLDLHTARLPSDFLPPCRPAVPPACLNPATRNMMATAVHERPRGAW